MRDHKMDKNLTDYITETHKQYIYRVKIAGEFPTETYDKFKESLGMFDVAECSAPRKTPIQSDPYGFPGLKNEEVTTFDVTLNYPANSEQLVELARRSGVQPAKVVIISKSFNDSMNKELEGMEKVEKSRLETPNYPAQTPEQKKASDDYADSYKKAAAEFANGSKQAKFEIAGDEKAAKDKDMGPEGTKSPISNIKRKSIKDMLKK